MLFSTSRPKSCPQGLKPIVLGSFMYGSGRTMARTGLRMMPTFPSSPLKFRTAGFPSTASRLAYQQVPSPQQRSRVAPSRFASCLRAHRFQRFVLRSVAEQLCAQAPPFKRLMPLYPSGPRSGPGSAVPVHQHLFGPIRPTRRHSAISLPGSLYALSSLCVAA